MSAASTADVGQIVRLAEADLPAVARIHSVAFPQSLLTALGPEAVRRYYEWNLLGPHDVVPLGIRRGEQLLGFCIGGVFRGALSGFVRRNRPYLIWRTLLALPGLGASGLRWTLRNAPGLLLRTRRPAAPRAVSASPAAPTSFGILSIAVDPASLGSGAARALMEAAEAEAWRLGFKRMHLSVRPENIRAVRFYEKYGWERVSTAGQWTGRMEKVLEVER
jgi:ribosomal protein S18 acetylase RimI-like enzyme